MLAHLEPIDSSAGGRFGIWEHNIQKDKVEGSVLFQCFERLVTGKGRGRLIPFRLNDLAKDLVESRVVFDDEDPGSVSHDITPLRKMVTQFPDDLVDLERFGDVIDCAHVETLLDHLGLVHGGDEDDRDVLCYLVVLECF
jgi:hypothetical protein